MEKEFYTLSEAAVRAGSILNAQTTPSDLLDSALNQILILSLRVAHAAMFYEEVISCGFEGVDKSRISEYSMMACNPPKFLQFSETLRPLHFGRSYDIQIETGDIKEVLLQLVNRLPGNNSSNVEFSFGGLILTLEDGSLARPVVDFDAPGYILVPDDGLLGVTKENLDAFVAKAQGSKVVDGGESISKSNANVCQNKNSYTKRPFNEFKAEKILHKTFEACANIHDVTRQAYTKAYKEAESKSKWGTQ